MHPFLLPVPFMGPIAEQELSWWFFSTTITPDFSDQTKERKKTSSVPPGERNKNQQQGKEIWLSTELFVIKSQNTHIFKVGEKGGKDGVGGSRLVGNAWVPQNTQKVSTVMSPVMPSRWHWGAAQEQALSPTSGQPHSLTSHPFQWELLTPHQSWYRPVHNLWHHHKHYFVTLTSLVLINKSVTNKKSGNFNDNQEFWFCYMETRAPHTSLCHSITRWLLEPSSEGQK